MKTRLQSLGKFKLALNLLTFALPTAAFSQTDNIGQPTNCLDPFTVAIEITQPKCYGDFYGSVVIDIQGGNPFNQGDNFDILPYLVDWDKNAFDGSTTIEYIPAGVYAVSITDQAGCNFTVDLALTEPEELVISGDITNATNNQNGAIDIDVTGGTGNYNYFWQNGAHTEDLQNVVSGTYSITVNDANNCTATKTFLVGDNRTVQNFGNSFAFANSAASRTTNDNITICPNPASDEVMIDWKDTDVQGIVMSNEYGRIVDQLTVSGQNIISVNSLRSGIHRLAFIDANNNIIANKNVIIQ